MELSAISKWFIKEVENLKSGGIVKDYKEIADNIEAKPSTISNVINGRRNIPRHNYLLFAKVYKLKKPLEEIIEIPDSNQFLIERIILIEAGMEVERSLLIEILATIQNKTKLDISTGVEMALEYQISKRKDELKRQ